MTIKIYKKGEESPYQTFNNIEWLHIFSTENIVSLRTKDKNIRCFALNRYEFHLTEE